MKKYILPLTALLIASCATTDPAPSSTAGAAGNIRYRYANTLNLGNDLTMDQVSVIGYDDHSVGESTRLDVTVNKASIALRSINAGNAMYTPSVETGPEGTLIVGWGEIDDGGCRVRLAVNPDGSLKIVSRKELDYSAGRR